MEDELIKFETAKLAKEKGFDLIVRYFYSDYSENKYIIEEKKDKNYNIQKRMTSAPTQSLLQKWLYEKHQIWVNSRPVYNANEQMGIEVDISSWRFPYKVIGENDQFDVYAGLEKGLQEALKLIK